MAPTFFHARTLGTSYIRCCYRPFLRKNLLCLLLAIFVLVMMAVTSQTRTMTQTVTERGVRTWNSTPQGSSTSPGRLAIRSLELSTPGHSSTYPEHQQTVGSGDPSGTKISQEHGITPLHSNTTESLLGKVTLEPKQPSAGQKGNDPMTDSNGEAWSPGSQGGSQPHAKISRRNETLKMDHENLGQLLALLQAEEEERNKEESENKDGESRQVFFLKVHKAASTTVMNILYRFAIKRKLNVMLPRRGNVLSETSKSWRHAAMWPPSGTAHFDILCNHLVFSKVPIRSALGNNVKFIGIVREPFRQFVSAFYFYRKVFPLHYLTTISEKEGDPVATYLKAPQRFEPRFASKSFTHNRMSFDFGLYPFMMHNEEHVKRYIHNLNETFDLVMISERFDESMVLMKRLLGWRLQDVMYTKNNVNTKLHHNYTAQQKRAHRNFNVADYRLYEHFLHVFQAKVEKEGKLFKEEVATFVALREKVDKFCQRGEADDVRLSATNFSTVFEVRKIDCQLMTLPEVGFVKLMRAWQYAGFD